RATGMPSGASTWTRGLTTRLAQLRPATRRGLRWPPEPSTYRGQVQTATTPGGAGDRPWPDRQRGEKRAGGAWLALPVFLLVSLLHLEAVLRLRTGAPFLTVGLVHTILFAGVAALLLAVVAGLLRGRARDVVVG